MPGKSCSPRLILSMRFLRISSLTDRTEYPLSRSWPTVEGRTMHLSSEEIERSPIIPTGPPAAPLCHVDAAVYVDVGAVDEAGRVGGEEDDHARHLVGPAQPAERRGADHPLEHVRRPGLGHRGVDDAGVDAVDA